MIDSDDTADAIVWPPLLALGTLILGFALDWVAPTFVLRVILPFELRVLIALFLVSGGAALAIVARREFLQMGTNVARSQPALRLVTTGIYAHFRNPMYVGLGLFVAGAGVGFACDWTLVLLVPAGLVLHYGVVRRDSVPVDRRTHPIAYDDRFLVETPHSAPFMRGRREGVSRVSERASLMGRKKKQFVAADLSDRTLSDEGEVIRVRKTTLQLNDRNSHLQPIVRRYRPGRTAKQADLESEADAILKANRAAKVAKKNGRPIKDNVARSAPTLQANKLASHQQQHRDDCGD
jgi:protein-S-isoprenylcysteine O-methyltransferase Ste14